jgi:hypothetical protein
MTVRLITVSLVWMIVAGCQSTSAPPLLTPTPAPIACGQPAPVVAAPAGTGLAEGIALAGLFLTASWRSGGDFQLGYPTKVAIHVTNSVTLTGRRCAGGQALRFWYREGGPPLGALPASISKLETTGDIAAQLATDATPNESHTGYILFPSPGDYALMAGPAGGTQLEAVVRVA